MSELGYFLFLSSHFLMEPLLFASLFASYYRKLSRMAEADEVTAVDGVEFEVLMEVPGTSVEEPEHAE